MRVCSLFSGIGGIDLGFQQAGFDIVWANEIDKYAASTYRYNFGSEHLTETDIRKVNPEIIKKSEPYNTEEGCLSLPRAHRTSCRCPGCYKGNEVIGKIRAFQFQLNRENAEDFIKAFRPNQRLHSFDDITVEVWI